MFPLSPKYQYQNKKLSLCILLSCKTAYRVGETFIFWLCLVTEALKHNGGGDPDPAPTADNFRSNGKVAINVKESLLYFKKKYREMIFTSRTVHFL